ncbi:3-oxoacyl-acyl-carrier- reductase [Fusarium sporotrichioides]|uniref:3-oxoacyl-acyl-carrier-reductase n=1 Tax=Fusarium sporotrichioides TaxID=5514 RepID=A0A395SNL1_FUSSP|nr:3-oxoacyl-acyl-carrier- reductase [Fusarium sporotrichioides]
MASEQYLAGKTAIVTGSSKLNGIGAATALALAKHGANIVIHYASNKEAAEKVVLQVKETGVQAIAVKADSSSESFGTDIVSATLEGLNTKTIDIIVNNAGQAIAHPEIAAIEATNWDDIFRTNVRGPFLLIQAALPHMTRGGRIINIGSIAGKLGIPALTVYGTSKAALTFMSTAMAGELAPKGITINVVSPGPTATDMTMEGTPIGEVLRSHQVDKREGEPREIAETILFIASPGSSFITGQVIPVDGGIYMP